MTKLDEMRAYVAEIRPKACAQLCAQELEALALAAIDEARAEERARCVGALRAQVGFTGGLDLISRPDAIKALESLK